jgi:hypothetical protein
LFHVGTYSTREDALSVVSECIKQEEKNEDYSIVELSEYDTRLECAEYSKEVFYKIIEVEPNIYGYRRKSFSNRKI